METIIGAALAELRSGLDGDLYQPGDAGYDEARAAWNLNAIQEPAVVVVAGSASDVAAAVRFALAEGLGVGVMATGHGVGTPCDGGVLINTSRMKGVAVDPDTRTARVEAGVLWRDLIPHAAEHGLAGLVGSTSGVSVVGYTLGGGFGWLGRKYGLAANSITEAEVVTANGELVTANASENADLFWSLKGGGGNFGIVTSLEFTLYPITTVYGGNLFYPQERAREVLELYSRWSRDLPDEMTSAVTFMNIPPIPDIPEPLRGKSFITVRGCYCGDDPHKGEELLAAWREFGEPEVDTFGVMPVPAMDAISMDPVDPIGASGHSELLRDLSPETIDALLEVAGPGSGSPLTILEARQLGGALTQRSGELSPMGNSGAGYILNAIGATPFPEMAEAVRANLAHLAETMRPHATGATYVNFMELDGASPERVEAAYTPEDYRRLKELKDHHDPRNVFRFNRNIAPTRAGA